MNKIGYAVGVIVIIAIIAVVAFDLKGAGAAAYHGNVAFSLTDPLSTPNGTTALVATYSSMQAQITDPNSTTSWVNINGNGTVDLMSLVNISQVIGTANISSNDMIKAVKFDITSAKITVDGQTYNVTIPNDAVTAQVNYTAKARSGANTTDVLLDLSPTVVTIYEQNSTVFVMVPSLRAIIIPLGSSASAYVGAKTDVNSSETTALSTAKANISITSAIVAKEGTQTMLQVTVKNNGNTNATLNQMEIEGNDSIAILWNSTPSNAGAPAKAILKTNSTINSSVIGNVINASANVLVNGKLMPNVEQQPSLIGQISTAVNGSIGDLLNANNMNSVNVYVNGQEFNISKTWFTSSSKGLVDSAISSLNVSSQTKLQLENVVSTTVQLNTYHSLFLQVGSGGGLTIEQSGAQADAQGYVITPGSTATFTFNQQMAYANGHILVTVVPQDNYTIIVTGANGAYATTNVVARNPAQ